MNEFLRARVLFLESALTEAAKSLETAAAWRQGENDDEDIWPWLRSRAMVARQALATSPPSVGESKEESQCKENDQAGGASQETTTGSTGSSVRSKSGSAGVAESIERDVDPRSSDAKHWDISPECAAGCQPGASPCEACRYWNYGAHCPNEAVTCRPCKQGMHQSCLAAHCTCPCTGHHRTQEAEIDSPPFTPASLEALEARNFERRNLQDRMSSDDDENVPDPHAGVRALLAMAWSGKVPVTDRIWRECVARKLDRPDPGLCHRPGEARQCDSCETRPASSWCNGCIIEDHQAAEISRPDKAMPCANCEVRSAQLCRSCVQEQIEEAVDHYISDDGKAHCHGCIMGARNYKCPGIPRPKTVTQEFTNDHRGRAIHFLWSLGEGDHDDETKEALAAQFAEVEKMARASAAAMLDTVGKEMGANWPACAASLIRSMPTGGEE